MSNFVNTFRRILLFYSGGFLAMMGKIWFFMILLSVISAIANGRLSELSASVSEGAGAGISLVLSIGGMIILWSAVLEVMKASGLLRKLTRLIRPFLNFLFPSAKNSPSVMEDISANVSANLLGLGNAATPAGISAARGLFSLTNNTRVSDDLCMFVVINTASLQLIPTTVAAIRGSLGASNPFDIIPAVWIATLFSQLVGICSAKLLAYIYKKRGI